MSLIDYLYKAACIYYACIVMLFGDGEKDTNGEEENQDDEKKA